MCRHARSPRRIVSKIAAGISSAVSFHSRRQFAGKHETSTKTQENVVFCPKKWYYIFNVMTRHLSDIILKSIWGNCGD